MDNLIRTIDTAIAANDVATLQAVFGGFGGPNSWQSVGQGEQRSIAAHLIVQAVQNEATFLTPDNLSNMMDVFVTALSHLPVSVEHAADNTLRQKIFQHLVHVNGDYSTAARILAGTRMEDEGPYQMTAAQKTDIHVSVAECFLQQDEIAESDSAVNKAGITVEQIPNKDQHTALILRYKSTYARVLDANRKFLQAASRYHELSQSSHSDVIAEEDLYNMLGRAATCAILAPSGPQRQRVLGHIANDERLGALETLPEFATHAAIVRKMWSQQILRPAELTVLEASLAPHQKAVMGDGLTILERGVVEHNMIAVSNLYESIYVTELAHILGVSNAKAESIAAKMILDDDGSSLHARATMDQVEGLLEFGEQDDAAGANPQETYDRSVTNFCLQLNLVTDAIKAKAAAASGAV